MVSPIIAMRMTLNYSSGTQGAASIPACLADISTWISAHHLKLNLDKTVPLFLPGKACPLQDLSITVDNSTVSPSQSAKNLGTTLDKTLSFSANSDSLLQIHALQYL